MASGTEEVILKASVSKLFKLQEDRVRVYQQFETYFSQYLDSGPQYDFTQYRSNVHRVTSRFQELSEGVREITVVLESANLKEAAALVEQLQQNEKEKLEVAAAFQLTRQSVVDVERELETFENSEEADPDMVEKKTCEAERLKLECTELKHRTQSLMQTIQDVLRDLRYELEDILLADEENGSS